MQDATPAGTHAQPTVQVIATTVDGTRAALSAAIPLASGSSARLILLVPQVVPFPVDLYHPADPIEFFVERYRQLITALGGDAEIEVCVCRRVDDVATRIAGADPVVIGGPTGRWLTSPEERLANRFARKMARVIFVASGPRGRQ